MPDNSLLSTAEIFCVNYHIHQILAPFDFYLFVSLQNSLDDKNFTSSEYAKQHLGLFFKTKSNEYLKKGIFLLPERWQKVIEQNKIRIYVIIFLCFRISLLNVIIKTAEYSGWPNIHISWSDHICPCHTYLYTANVA